MASDNQDNSCLAVKFLESQSYNDVKPLGRGSFGDVLSAISPEKQQVAVKIIHKESYRIVEDQIWPVVDHPNVLSVLDVIAIPELEMKLFVSPRLSTALFQMVHSADFLADVRGLDRVRKWMREVLSGLDYLHTAGFSHMDIKSDNVLISSNDTAVICDFSGLSITEIKTTRLCAPFQFRPPECYHAVGSKGIHGVPFDMWTYGLMALNVMTGHWPQTNMEVVAGWSWDTHTKPVLMRALNESSLAMLMRHALPSVQISSQDVSDAQHFVLSCMRMNPDERPTAKRAASLPFLLSSGNTAVELCSGDFKPATSEAKKDLPLAANPFRSPPQPAKFEELATTALVVSEKPDLALGDCFENKAFNADSDSSFVENAPTASPIVKVEKKKSSKKRITGWFAKKIRKLLPKRKNYVILCDNAPIN